MFARFRYNDLKEAARGCGGRGPYANSMVAAARHTRPHAPISWLPRKSISKSVVEEAEKRDLFDGKAQKSGACGGTRRFLVRGSRFMPQP